MGIIDKGMIYNISGIARKKSEKKLILLTQRALDWWDSHR
jgi:hypothetical protein